MAMVHPVAAVGREKKKVSVFLETEKCDVLAGLCHPGSPLNGTAHIKRRIVTVHLNMGLKATENIQKIW